MYKINFNQPLHIHFIGIGGISMSGLAEILIKEGFIKRTPRGREVTDLAYTHLGRSRVGEQGSLFD